MTDEERKDIQNSIERARKLKVALPDGYNEEIAEKEINEKFGGDLRAWFESIIYDWVKESHERFQAECEKNEEILMTLGGKGVDCYSDEDKESTPPHS